MKDSTQVEYDLVVEVRNSHGVMKDVRHVHHSPGRTTEFVPNRLYLHLLNRGVIKNGEWKIPLLLGTRKRQRS